MAKKIIFSGVLGGYYSGILGREPLIHAYIEGEEKSLCKRILVSHFSDKKYDLPTCPICKRKVEAIPPSTKVQGILA